VCVPVYASVCVPVCVLCPNVCLRVCVCVFGTVVPNRGVAAHKGAVKRCQWWMPRAADCHFLPVEGVINFF